MFRWFSLVSLVAAGCAPYAANNGPSSIFAPVDTGDPDGDDSAAPACELRILSVTPQDGQGSVPTDALISVTFDGAASDQPWTLFVEGVAGEAVLAEDELSAFFAPSEPLAHDADYTVVASACDSEIQVPFHTRAAPVEPDLLVGHTYFVPWKGAKWEYPALAETVVGDLDVEGIALQVVGASAYGQSLDLLGAVEPADDGIQDPACWPTFVYENASFANNPDLAAGPTLVELPLGEHTLRLEDTWIFGTFGESGKALNDVSIVTRVDTRALDAWWGQDVCDMAAYLEDQCEPCEDGAVECLPAKLTVLQAPWKSDLDLEAIRTSDAECI